MVDAEALERERRAGIYARLALLDRRRSIFGWPESPPRREWSDPGRVALWRPESWTRS